MISSTYLSEVIKIAVRRVFYSYLDQTIKMVSSRWRLGKRLIEILKPFIWGTWSSEAHMTSACIEMATKMCRKMSIANKA